MQLNALFTSNMVWQRDQMLPVWDTASVGEKVSVDIGAQKRQTIAAPDGSWRVVFKPLSAMTNLPFRVTGNNKALQRADATSLIAGLASSSNWVRTRRLEENISSALVNVVSRL